MQFLEKISFSNWLLTLPPWEVLLVNISVVKIWIFHSIPSKYIILLTDTPPPTWGGWFKNMTFLHLSGYVILNFLQNDASGN